MSEALFALLTGGGTGGHTYPAIAVAHELRERGRSVRFVGGRRGIEGRVVPEAGYEIDLLPGRGLQRRLTLANVAALWDAARAFVRALALVRQYRPRIVVGFGGYASMPCVLAARVLRVPVVVHEQDAAPGLANRIGVRVGARAAISLPDTPLRGAQLTGNPVRAQFVEATRAPEYEPALIAVFGGAQGARTINRAAIGCYDRWRARSDLAIHHVCGPTQFETCESELAGARRADDVVRYELVAYEPEMQRLLARAALAVCRAGAGTLAELTVVGVPAVLVPLPGAPSDHQTRNAQTLERAGAAVMLRDAECDPPRLDALVQSLLQAPDRLQEMGKAARTLGRPDAAARVADLIEEVAGGADGISVPALDLTEPKRLHIVGVAGAGMSAIALVLARMGHRVSGSDIKAAAVLERLAVAGVDIHVGNRAEHVPMDADAVVYSTAIPESNVELVAARAAGIAVLHRSAALAALAATRRTIAVAGSHGKTTTASMLALILQRAGWQPSFVIGGEVNEVGSNAAFGAGEWIVIEADESDGTFLHLAPQAALITNVEPDHLDYYGGFPELVAAFTSFVDSVDGPIVMCADDAVAAQLAATRSHVRTYGADVRANYRVADERSDAHGSRFTLHVDGRAHTLSVPVGVKAATNAAGAVALAHELGVELDVAAAAIAGFGGVARRFQFRGESAGVSFVDDYAHLPSEVAAAIATARQGAWKRVIAVFQPHRYSRTASLWREFADAFTAADAVVLTDVYAAGESPIPGVSGRLLVHAVLDAHPALPVAYLPRRDDLRNLPARMARPGDVVLTLGAGDLTAMPDEWLGREESP